MPGLRNAGIRVMLSEKLMACTRVLFKVRASFAKKVSLRQMHEYFKASHPRIGAPPLSQSIPANIPQSINLLAQVPSAAFVQPQPSSTHPQLHLSGSSPQHHGTQSNGDSIRQNESSIHPNQNQIHESLGSAVSPQPPVQGVTTPMTPPYPNTAQSSQALIKIIESWFHAVTFNQSKKLLNFAVSAKGKRKSIYFNEVKNLPLEKLEKIVRLIQDSLKTSSMQQYNPIEHLSATRSVLCIEQSEGKSTKAQDVQKTQAQDGKDHPEHYLDQYSTKDFKKNREESIDKDSTDKIDKNNKEDIENYNTENIENYNTENIENHNTENIENYNIENTKNYHYENIDIDNTEDNIKSKAKDSLTSSPKYDSHQKMQPKLMEGKYSKQRDNITSGKASHKTNISLKGRSLSENPNRVDTIDFIVTNNHDLQPLSTVKLLTKVLDVLSREKHLRKKGFDHLAKWSSLSEQQQLKVRTTLFANSGRTMREINAYLKVHSYEQKASAKKLSSRTQNSHLDSFTQVDELTGETAISFGSQMSSAPMFLNVNFQTQESSLNTTKFEKLVQKYMSNDSSEAPQQQIDIGSVHSTSQPASKHTLPKRSLSLPIEESTHQGEELRSRKFSKMNRGFIGTLSVLRRQCGIPFKEFFSFDTLQEEFEAYRRLILDSDPWKNTLSAFERFYFACCRHDFEDASVVVQELAEEMDVISPLLTRCLLEDGEFLKNFKLLCEVRSNFQIRDNIFLDFQLFYAYLTEEKFLQELRDNHSSKVLMMKTYCRLRLALTMAHTSFSVFRIQCKFAKVMKAWKQLLLEEPEAWRNLLKDLTGPGSSLDSSLLVLTFDAIIEYPYDKVLREISIFFVSLNELSEVPDLWRQTLLLDDFLTDLSAVLPPSIELKMLGRQIFAILSAIEREGLPTNFTVDLFEMLATTHSLFLRGLVPLVDMAEYSPTFLIRLTSLLQIELKEEWMSSKSEESLMENFFSAYPPL